MKKITIQRCEGYFVFGVRTKKTTAKAQKVNTNCAFAIVFCLNK
jgi:hypothetical protein